MEQAEARTHATRALIALRRRILSGEIPGGTRLYEVPLAEDLQISRTPVREAMSRLVEEGLLERARSGGFVVRSFGIADVIDSIELRGVMEGTAARLAAERGVKPDDLDRMREIVKEIDECFGEEPGDVVFERYAELNARFHEQLARLCGSKIVEMEVLRASRLPFASPSAFLPDRTRIAAFRRSLNIAQEQHRAIVAAIAAREGARAEALAREHARIARHNMQYLLDVDRSLMARVPSLALVVD
ncbi:MAG: GntR family transcriptional regulator [Rhizobiaceae bacterium]|jgi:GntR family transcriptional regulator of vanillate catabolism